MGKMKGARIGVGLVVVLLAVAVAGSAAAGESYGSVNSVDPYNTKRPPPRRASGLIPSSHPPPPAAYVDPYPGATSSCPPYTLTKNTCPPVVITIPFVLTFDTAIGVRPGDYRSPVSSVYDQNGIPTGFTMVEADDYAWYNYKRLKVDIPSKTLTIYGQPGVADLANNKQENRLGVGFPTPHGGIMAATIIKPYLGTLREQAGLWFGPDQDNYVRYSIVSVPGVGHRLELYVEIGGAPLYPQLRFVNLGDVSMCDVRLSLTLNSTTPPLAGGAVGQESVSARYLLNGTNPRCTNTWITFVPYLGTGPNGALWSADAASINSDIGTNSFGGIYASLGNAQINWARPVGYVFANFTIDALVGQCNPTTPPSSKVKFTRQDTRTYYSPTAFVWSELDSRLYGVDYNGTIHRYTFDALGNIIEDKEYHILSGLLTLGIAIEPSSTANNIILWITSSQGKGRTNSGKDEGQMSSSKINRIWGPNFEYRTIVFYGLPRSPVDHSLNGLKFAPDRRTLCWSQSSNTGSGAANDLPRNFGTRAETVTSAAMYCSQVLGPGGIFKSSFIPDLHGNCTVFLDASTGMTQTRWPTTCNATIIASGLRNIYDFAFHSQYPYIYGANNGVGLPSTVPNRTANGLCMGNQKYTKPRDPFDPGTQPDYIYRINPARRPIAFHGHPNPSRFECIFQDGSLQKVKPDPRFVQYLWNLGGHHSADGVVEYKSNRFCGEMKGELLWAQFSTPNNVIRVKLMNNGLAIKSIYSIAECLDSPLAIASDPLTGNVFVGSFNQAKYSNGMITVLRPDFDERTCGGGPDSYGNIVS